MTLYPVTVNDATEPKFTAAVIQEVFGKERFQLSPHPMPQSDDFSRVLEAVPGAFLMLSAGPPEMNPDTAPFNHSGTALFDDSLLVDGAQKYALLALKRLKLRSDNTLALR